MLLVPDQITDIFGDGLVHIEMPRWHNTLCGLGGLGGTRYWDLVNGRPVSCLACIGLQPQYYEL